MPQAQTLLRKGEYSEGRPETLNGGEFRLSNPMLEGSRKQFEQVHDLLLPIQIQNQPIPYIVTKNGANRTIRQLPAF